MASLLQFPCKALGAIVSHLLHQIGLAADVKKLAWFSVSDMMRAYSETMPDWRDWCHEMRRAAEGALDVSALHLDMFKHLSWDSFPIAMHSSFLVGPHAAASFSYDVLVPSSYDLAYSPPAPLASLSLSSCLRSSLSSVPSFFASSPSSPRLRKLIYSSIKSHEFASLSLTSPQFRNIQWLRDGIIRVNLRAEAYIATYPSLLPKEASSTSLFAAGSNMFIIIYWPAVPGK